MKIAVQCINVLISAEKGSKTLPRMKGNQESLSPAATRVTHPLCFQESLEGCCLYQQLSPNKWNLLGPLSSQHWIGLSYLILCCLQLGFFICKPHAGVFPLKLKWCPWKDRCQSKKKKSLLTPLTVNSFNLRSKCKSVHLSRHPSFSPSKKTHHGLLICSNYLHEVRGVS